MNRKKNENNSIIIQGKEKPAFIIKWINLLLSAGAGALLLGTLSFLQKVSAGYSLKPQGFVVPAIIGGCCGIALYILFRRQFLALAQVQEQTTFLNAILDNMMAGVMLIDPQSKEIKMVSCRACEMLGYSLPEFLKKKCFEIFPDTVGNSSCMTAEESGYNARCIVLRSDGALLHVQKSTARVCLDEHVYILETFLDVTQQINAEQYAEDIFNSVGSQLAVIAESGKVLAVNQSWKNFDLASGGSPECCRVAGSNYFETGIAANNESVVAGIRAVATGGSPLYEMEYPCHSSSERRWFLQWAFPLKNKQGCAVVGHTDISRLKCAQLAAAESRNQLEFVMEAAHIGTWDFLVKSGFVRYNRQLMKMLGYDENEIEPSFSFWLSILHPEDLPEFQDGMQQHLSGQITMFSAVCRMLHKSEGWRWFMTQGKVIERSAGGDALRAAGICVDITEKKELEQHLYKAQKMESLGLLVGSISHDFNNILTPIMGYTDILLRREDKYKESEQQFLEEIRKASGHARDLIKQLLAFGKNQHIPTTRMNPGKVIRNMEKLLGAALPDEVTLHIDAPEDATIILIDKGRVEQVLMNLVMNARDAIGVGGGTIVISTGVRELDRQFCLANPDVTPGRYCVIRVSDTGCGMEQGTVQYIFEPYFSTKKERGTGLGLAGVYGIVDQHKGCITVDSIPGKGTRFSIYLPVHEELPTGGDMGTVYDPPAISLQQGRIMVVDDNEMISEMAETMLTELGYTVFTEKNGIAALTFLEHATGSVDLVISDLDMPEMNGAALYDILSERYPHIQVIIMSGYMETVLSRYPNFKEGGVGFLNKPFSMDKLSTAVQSMLSSASRQSKKKHED